MIDRDCEASESIVLAIQCGNEHITMSKSIHFTEDQEENEYVQDTSEYNAFSISNKQHMSSLNKTASSSASDKK